jgi:hypothetical protein
MCTDLNEAAEKSSTTESEKRRLHGGGCNIIIEDCDELLV